MSVSSGITMSQVPEGYDIGEMHGNTRVFSCPDNGCDGLVFYTAEECKLHEENWHDDPYMCTCGREFASRHALERHMYAEWHEEVKPDTFSCTEECCPKYEEEVGSQHNLSVHNGSAIHRAAEERSSYFDRIRDIIEKSLQSRIVAFRDLICDVPSCPDFGRQWASPSSFLIHVETESHTKYNEAFKKAMTSGPSRLENEDKQRWAFQCHKDGCDGYRQRFRTNVDYRTHCASTSHVEAIRQTVPRLQTPDVEIVEPDVQEIGGLLSPPDTEPSATPRRPTRIVIDLTISPKKKR